MSLMLRQTAGASRSRSVHPSSPTDLRGGLWAFMVQTHVAGDRLEAFPATNLLTLSEMGTVPGVTDPEGAGVKPSRQETKEVTESTGSVH